MRIYNHASCLLLSSLCGVKLNDRGVFLKFCHWLETLHSSKSQQQRCCQFRIVSPSLLICSVLSVFSSYALCRGFVIRYFSSFYLPSSMYLTKQALPNDTSPPCPPALPSPSPSCPANPPCPRPSPLLPSSKPQLSLAGEGTRLRHLHLARLR